MTQLDNLIQNLNKANKRLKEAVKAKTTRNLITHTYNEKMADKIYSQALKFPQEVNSLLEKIS